MIARGLAILAGLLAVGACDRAAPTTGDHAVAATAGDRTPGAAPPPGATRVAGEHYVVDVVPPSQGCVAGTPCDVRIDVFALGAYKVNVDYPTKFVPTPTEGLAFEAPARLRPVGVAAGELPVRVRAAAPGPTTLRGEVKLGICDAARCENAVAPVALELAVR
ncbi:MAG: hypothetical protein R2939_18885 [Kofleriaceae bacterium]